MINNGSPIMNQYYYSPATRFQSNFGGQPAGSPGVAQFGTLGYNPTNNYGYYNPQYSNYGATLNQPAMNNIYQCVDKTMVIEGYNPSNNEALITAEIDKKMNDLAKRICKEQEEQLSKQRELMNANPYNYYGSINNGMNPYTLARYRNEQEALYQEAVEERRQFNKKLSIAARKYLGLDTDEEEINQIYDARTVTIPANEVQETYKMKQLESFTIDQSEITKQQFNSANNEISRRHHEIIKEDCDLKTFLDNAGRLLYEMEFEELQSTKRDKSNLYQQSSFSQYLDKQVNQRDGNNSVSSLFPNLMKNGSILEDGTISLKCPDWAKKNEAESSYEADRQRFIQSIYNPT